MLHVFLSFIICRLYKLTFSEQAQFTLQVRVSVSDLVYRFVDRPSLAGIQKKSSSTRTQSHFWHPCRQESFETTLIVTVCIAELLIVAFITKVW